MFKRLKPFVITTALAFIAAAVAHAANVHFKNSSAPTFSDQGTQLQSCFCLAGLGNADVTITVKTTGTATTLCTNPGGTAAPGQNKVPVKPSASQTFPATEIKNGNLCACLTTPPPPNPSAKAAGCPNNNWTASITDVTFATAEVVVVQSGKVVLDQKFNL
jgi:hypothetical protein